MALFQILMNALSGPITAMMPLNVQTRTVLFTATVLVASLEMEHIVKVTDISSLRVRPVRQFINNSIHNHLLPHLILCAAIKINFQFSSVVCFLN